MEEIAQDNNIVVEFILLKHRSYFQLPASPKPACLPACQPAPSPPRRQRLTQHRPHRLQLGNLALLLLPRCCGQCGGAPAGRWERAGESASV